MDKVYDWLGSLVQKNHRVYALHKQLQNLIADNKTCTNLVRLQKIDEEITSIEA